MIKNHSPDFFFTVKNSRNRRVKSEIPETFKEPNLTSTRQHNSKNSLKNSENIINRSNEKIDESLTKHREIILTLLKQSSSLEESLISKLKDITYIPDLLTDVIFKKIRGNSPQPRSNKHFIEEITEYRKYASNLQSQLLKAKQSNEELTSMLLSVDVQQKLSKDLNESISLITTVKTINPKRPHKKKIIISPRLEYDRILQVAQKEKLQDGLKLLCEEVRRTILADNVVVLTPNPQQTHYSGIINGQHTLISAKSTVLFTVFTTGESISAKIGDHNFDPRIQQVLKMKVKAFSAGLLYDHLGSKLGILLIIRKRPELMFERELNNLLNIFSLYIIRWKLYESCNLEKRKSDEIISACGELLNTVTLQEFMLKLQNKIPMIFNCERGNVLLFDYEKNNLFRKLGESSYENFPIFQGLSGHCVNTKRPYISNDVTHERIFHKEMDDPFGTNTKCILSVPIFSKIYDKIPEAVIQLINKEDGGIFLETDMEGVIKFAAMITDCMIVLKFSQLSASLVDVIRKLEESLEKMSEDMRIRVYDFSSVKSSIGQFKGFFTKYIQ